MGVGGKKGKYYEGLYNYSETKAGPGCIPSLLKVCG